MTLPGAPVVRRNVAVGAVCATVLLVTTELVVPATLGGRTSVTAQYTLYLLTFSAWMAWFVLTGVAVLADAD
ncbi:hypothetical protein [Halogeometricum limi]|uniref:Uncharacterized protein n=1 Tax=Halogeometricum limi TaxID=555875 RepID=A0A1I6HCF9_9EURY|nr:hypothetical protein [Halogeometricum limi]SFR52119.1 hypothetical protein SAMN04488124_2054 [Halogeometricum limi]